MTLFFIIIFNRFSDRGGKLQYLIAILIYRIKSFVCQIFGFIEQSQPISRLVALLQSYVHFGFEIVFTDTILSFSNIRTDTRSTSQQLLRWNILAILFPRYQILT